ncbi:hypothetical protein LEL84_16675 [Gordonia sp. WA4-43]|nr:hypothetical protein [Gordonia sp. WA4-43]UCZ88704.1 hypothetical protein LEL84_16675 [Gordonia sp. WA4-43]
MTVTKRRTTRTRLIASATAIACATIIPALTTGPAQADATVQLSDRPSRRS